MYLQKFLIIFPNRLGIYHHYYHRDTHFVWARLRSARAEPRCARPDALDTLVPLRLRVRREWQEEHTAESAASSKAGTLARDRNCRFTSREMPAIGWKK